MVRFDNYHFKDPKTGDQLPRCDGAYIKKMPDATVRIAALRAGDMDFVETPPYNILADYIKNPRPGITMSYDMPGNYCIWLNNEKAPFNNKKVRQAVEYAVNRKEIQEGAFWGLGQLLPGQPFAEDSRFYIPTKVREQNIAKGKQLLAEAGYPNGLKVECAEYNRSSYLDNAAVIIGQLKEIGMDVKITITDRAPYFRALRSGNYVMSCGALSERLDWDDAYYVYFHSKEIGKHNFTRYNNPEVDRLVEQGRSVWGFEKRKKIYKKVVEILHEDTPMVFTCDSVVGQAYRNDLKGFVKGFAVRYAFYEGGIKYWWIDKS